MYSDIKLPNPRREQALRLSMARLRFADDPRANENWIARNLRLMGVIA